MCMFIVLRRILLLSVEGKERQEMERLCDGEKIPVLHYKGTGILYMTENCLVIWLCLRPCGFISLIFVFSACFMCVHRNKYQHKRFQQGKIASTKNTVFLLYLCHSPFSILPLACLSIFNCSVICTVWVQVSHSFNSKLGLLYLPWPTIDLASVWLLFITMIFAYHHDGTMCHMMISRE